MVTREERKAESESMKQHHKENPEEKKRLVAIRKKNREMIYGEGVITRGKNAGLKKGTGTQPWHSPKHSKEDLQKAHKHMHEHMR